MNNILIVFFWIGMSVVFYTFLGYGMLIWLLVKIKNSLKEPPLNAKISDYPDVTLVIAAYNEELIVHQKMANCNQLMYPADKLHICWITDGSNDSTNELLKAYPAVQLLFQPVRQGKTAAINRGMPFINSPIIVFTDANTMLNPSAITEIVHRFADPKVGCVAGEKRILLNDKGDATAGEGIYWKYESVLKTLDDQLHSAVGAAGELYAIRKELFTELPSDTLLDDFMLSMLIAAKGYKIAYCKTAFALEEPSSDMREEEKRKVRIAAGGMQSILRLWPLLNPFKYGLLSFQYISHRVLRWSVTPIVLFLLYPLNVVIIVTDPIHHLVYTLLLLFQILFYGAGFMGRLLAVRKIHNKLLYVPYYFLFMNISVLKGFVYLKKRKGTGIWEKAKRANQS